MTFGAHSNAGRMSMIIDDIQVVWHLFVVVLSAAVSSEQILIKLSNLKFSLSKNADEDAQATAVFSSGGGCLDMLDNMLSQPQF